MPEYQKSDIPINDSHLGAGKKLSQTETRFISSPAVFFLLFWCFVATAVLIYWQWSKVDGVHYVRAIRNNVRFTPEQEKPDIKTPVSSQTSEHRPSSQNIRTQGHFDQPQLSKTSSSRSERNPAQVKPKREISSSSQFTFANKNSQKRALSGDTDHLRRTTLVTSSRSQTKRRSSRKTTYSPHIGMNVEALQKKARELARQRKWAEAARLSEHVVQKSPHSLKDRRFLGLCLLNASQYQRGIKELEKVLRYGRVDAVVEHHIGHAYYNVGSYDKALAAFKKAVRIDPLNPRHYKCGARLIVEVYRIRPSFYRDFPLARTWYEKALALGMHPTELAEIRGVLEKNSRLALRNN